MGIHDLECCGLKELDGLSDHPGAPSEALLRFFTYAPWNSPKDRQVAMYALSCGAFIFTEAAKGTYGADLSALIEKEKLGTVTPLPAFKNPNSQNEVRTYFWIFNRRRLVSWLNKELKKNPASA